MAGRFKFVLVGGLVIGIATGTIAALTLAGGDNNVVDARRESEVPRSSPESREAEKAAAANDAGRDRIYAGDFHGASALFREAADRHPDPRYFLNLGTSLSGEGKLNESLTALDGVFTTNPTDALKGKALTLAKRLLWDCEHQYVACQVPPTLRAALLPGVYTPKRIAKARELYLKGQENLVPDKPGDATHLGNAQTYFENAAKLIPDPVYLSLAAEVWFKAGAWPTGIMYYGRVFSNNPTPAQADKAKREILRILALCDAAKKGPNAAYAYDCRAAADTDRQREFPSLQP